MCPLIITEKEAEEILKSKSNKINISLDLGLSKTEIKLEQSFAIIKKHRIPLLEFEKVKEDFCYAIENKDLRKIAFFSEETNFYYKLAPTQDWPTIKFSSTPMHRHKKISPKRDVYSKIREISPVKGKVLDTCCGLGYTAILSSKTADVVHTFEKDKNVIFLAKINPYSRELFKSKKIKFKQGNILDEITNFEDSFFDRVLHDPPTFKYAPELYSKDFYKALFRVMKNSGILYHYAPWPHKTKNKVFYKSIVRKLKECGFSNVKYKRESCGVRAVKKRISGLNYHKNY